MRVLVLNLLISLVFVSSTSAEIVWVDGVKYERQDARWFQFDQNDYRWEIKPDRIAIRYKPGATTQSRRELEDNLGLVRQDGPSDGAGYKRFYYPSAADRYGVSQPIVVGEDRRVVLDVTSVVRAYLRSPSQNYGFVMGSLSDMREGKFTLQAGSFSDGSLARLHLYTAPQPTR